MPRGHDPVKQVDQRLLPLAANWTDDPKAEFTLTASRCLQRFDRA